MELHKDLGELLKEMLEKHLISVKKAKSTENNMDITWTQVLERLNEGEITTRDFKWDGTPLITIAAVIRSVEYKLGPFDIWTIQNAPKNMWN